MLRTAPAPFEKRNCKGCPEREQHGAKARARHQAEAGKPTHRRQTALGATVPPHACWIAGHGNGDTSIRNALIAPASAPEPSNKLSLASRFRRAVATNTAYKPGELNLSPGIVISSAGSSSTIFKSSGPFDGTLLNTR